ncbi:MAG: SMI1/KNR4 family protein [Planctomycetota bacterium]|jgi:hypothetical protein
MASKIPCENCKQSFKPTPWQAKFVAEAKVKGMQLTMLECQNCGLTTRFNPLTGKPPAARKRPKRLPAKQGATNVPLPQDYKEFLKTHDGRFRFVRGGRDWKLATLDELKKKIDVGEWECPYMRQLAAFAREFAKAFEDDSTSDTKGRPYDLTRLAGGLAVGDENADVLFLDPDNDHSVWCFYHDDGSVEKMATSFSKWLARTKKEPA